MSKCVRICLVLVILALIAVPFAASALADDSLSAGDALKCASISPSAGINCDIAVKELGNAIGLRL